MAIKSNFVKYAWGMLIINLGVIIWGAFVRATGSGAGCGSHWPLCNGVVIPRPDRLATLIEFIHRGTSGIAFLGVVVLVIWAWRAFPRNHIVRWGALSSLFFMVTEALVGASLVLFHLVAENDSVARAIIGAIHLINTFFLLAFLSLTAWWASGGEVPSLKKKDPRTWLLGLGLLGMLVLGMSGAVTALGDTLYPSSSIAQGLQQDFSTTSHYLIRLRVLHPTIAIGVSIYLIIVTGWINLRRSSRGAFNLGRLLPFIILGQIMAGLINVYLLAPVWMQLVHLFLADGVWIILVLFSAKTLGLQNASSTIYHQDQLSSQPEVT